MSEIYQASSPRFDEDWERVEKRMSDEGLPNSLHVNAAIDPLKKLERLRA